MKTKEYGIVADVVGTAVAITVGRFVKSIITEAVVRGKISRASLQAEEVKSRVDEVQRK